jgi:hypothetical protein
LISVNTSKDQRLSAIAASLLALLIAMQAPMAAQEPKIAKTNLN